MMRPYISLVKVISFATFLFTSVSSLAQVPHYGIYALFHTTDNIFPSGYYAAYIVDPGQFYNVDLVADKEIERYNLPYALVSVDSAEGVLKIALLRDTVSKTGKEKLNALLSGAHYNESPQSSFELEFQIHGDTVSDRQTDGEGFAGNSGITGRWVFDKNIDYGNVLAFVNPQPRQQRLQRFDSVSHADQYGSSFTFEESFFHPYRNNPSYADLIYTFDHDSIPLYATADRHNRSTVSYFRSGGYIAVKKDSAEWLLADRIIVVPDTEKYYLPGRGMFSNEHDLKIISGWVRKEDLVDYPWTKQKQQTALFSFEVSGKAADTSDDSEGEVDAIKIINKRTGQEQLIMDIGAELYDSLDDVLQVQDCNFDGYPDIWIRAQDGGASPNYTHNYYLYNPHTGQFDYNEPLSGLSQIEIDSKAKIISSSWRDGAAHHGARQYTFMHDTLVKISYWDNMFINGATFNVTKFGKLMNGKWNDSIYYTGNITSQIAFVYADPDQRSKPVDTLKQGDYADIHNETPLWFYVDATDSQNNDVKGWIKKTDLLAGRWISLGVQTREFRFEAASVDSSAASAVRIIDKKSGKTVQIIPVYEGMTLADSSFKTGDYNGDGRADIRMIMENGGEAVTIEYFYNAAIGLFTKETTGPVL